MMRFGRLSRSQRERIVANDRELFPDSNSSRLILLALQYRDARRTAISHWGSDSADSNYHIEETAGRRKACQLRDRYAYVFRQRTWRLAFLTDVKTSWKLEEHGA